MQADGSWSSNPDTSADDDLSRARFIIAGLAGEAVVGRDKPGSSLDELGLSQLIGHNAGVKLGEATDSSRLLTLDDCACLACIDAPGSLPAAA